MRKEILNYLKQQTQEKIEQAKQQIQTVLSEKEKQTNQLQQLGEYQKYYREAYNEKIILGMNQMEIQNYYGFISKIDSAIVHQIIQVEKSINNIDKATNKLVEQKKEMNKWNVLEKKEKEKFDKKNKTIENKQHDEIAIAIWRKNETNKREK